MYVPNVANYYCFVFDRISDLFFNEEQSKLPVSIFWTAGTEILKTSTRDVSQV